MQPQLDAKTPIVVLEPSCAAVFKDELPNLFPHDSRAAQLADQVFLLSEFLVRHAPNYQPAKTAQPIVVHAHCHHRALFTMKDEMALLTSVSPDARLLDSGCCGMAGPFGFEADKFDLSEKLAERVLLPEVRQHAANSIIVSDGFSCREQIFQLSGTRALHLAEVLAANSREAGSS